MTTSSDIRIRISNEQKQQLKNLANASGHKTISQFVRSRVFDGDLALHSKVNRILDIVSGTGRDKTDKTKMDGGNHG